MLLSDQVTYADIFATLEESRDGLGRKVNPTILTSNEFYNRVRAEEAFLTRVLAKPKVWIIGGESDLAV